MENLCVITDFEEITMTRKFHQIESPRGLEQYSIFIGGNFIFIRNERNMTIRFHLPNFGTNITEEVASGWLRKIKTMYPSF